MERVAEAGGVILPSVLTFYSGGRTIEEQIDCLLGKALLLVCIMLPATGLGGKMSAGKLL